jgi:hypothetical protein
MALYSSLTIPGADPNHVYRIRPYHAATQKEVLMGNGSVQPFNGSDWELWQYTGTHFVNIGESRHSKNRI